MKAKKKEREREINGIDRAGKKMSNPKCFGYFSIWEDLAEISF